MVKHAFIKVSSCDSIGQVGAVPTDTIKIQKDKTRQGGVIK